MWKRFSERARKIVFFAQEEAERFGEGFVSTEHLLLGLIRESDSTSVKVLERLGMSRNRVRIEIEKQLPHGDARGVAGSMTLTPRAKRVIDLAYDESRERNENFIGTEHLLLGLIRDVDSLAARVLVKLGVTLDKARAAVGEARLATGSLPVVLSERRSLPQKGWGAVCERTTKKDASQDYLQRYRITFFPVVKNGVRRHIDQAAMPIETIENLSIEQVTAFGRAIRARKGLCKGFPTPRATLTDLENFDAQFAVL